MKLYWSNFKKKQITNLLKLAFFALVIQSCATHHSQFGSSIRPEISTEFENPKNISHTFYLIGDAGNATTTKSKQALSLLEARLQKADTNSTLIFLGDNIYPKGMPKNDSSERKSAEQKLNNQLLITKKFKGKTVFIPGNHDWYNGLEGLQEQEKIVLKYLNQKRSFLPKNSCAMDAIDINENVGLIVIDSQWYFEDWDKHPTINENCNIKTRAQFFEALENKINEFQNKTVIIAMHHPLFSNGAHGGQFTIKKHIFPFDNNIPLPGIGNLINQIRKTSGLSPQDLQNRQYIAFVKQIKAFIEIKNNIIVVSGHDHNLQYIEKNNIKQIISGAGSKEQGARALGKKDFSFGKNGYAVLEVQKNGASKVSFYGKNSKRKEGLLFRQLPTFARAIPNLKEFPKQFEATKDTSIYTNKMTTKRRFYRFLWGNHYRKVYSKSIVAKTVALDTLFGGLTPTIAGAEHQSKTLQLTDKNGKEYVMSSLKKSATRLLQTVAFKNQTVANDFKNTYTEDFILDFYTTSHPYTPLVVGKLADKIGLNHTNPKLFYVPKQNALKLFNEDFGNELYFIEERPTDGFKNNSIIGKPSKIISTEAVLANLQTDKKYKIDENEYIKARLFDILIGDWDRNADQWLWGEFKEQGAIIYRPIPIDRDQAFTKYDGKLLSYILKFAPLRHMKTFDDELKSVKWFNREAYNLDQALLKKSNEIDWITQAQFIEKNLSNAEIDKAFENLPKEIKDDTIEKIKSDLKIRKTNLSKYAATYFGVLQKTVLIVGTDKKDKFVINRANNTTQIQVFSLNKTGEELISDEKYSYPKTKELWIYGLDDDDVFEVKGNPKKAIKIRLLGGLNNDLYNVENGKKIKIYDFKSKENTLNEVDNAKVLLSDNYQINTYDYKKPKYNVFGGLPLLGFNPDDGLKVGGTANYIVNGFKRFPYTQKHVFRGNYFFATNGFELGYKATFPHAINNWNLALDALYTSPNFSINFFGFGNETTNENNKDRDFNRVKIRTIKVTPSIEYTGKLGSITTFQASFERFDVENTPDRFLQQYPILNPTVFDAKNFVDLNAKYSFENYDNNSNPTLGITFSVAGGYKININETKRQFPYAESVLGFTQRISKSGNLVLATLAKGKVLFNNNYEFYQAATVGGDFDLRGFRNQRFSGKNSFYHSSDLRLNLGKLKNGLAPIRYGVFGGFDYGRVWFDNESSEKWHQSYGGGFWINGVQLVTGQLSVFNSTDGLRLAVGIGFGL